MSLINRHNVGLAMQGLDRGKSRLNFDPKRVVAGLGEDLSSF